MLTEQLESVSFKLNKLDLIESRLRNVEHLLQTVNTDVTTLKTKVGEIESSMCFMTKKMNK